MNLYTETIYLNAADTWEDSHNDSYESFTVYRLQPMEVPLPNFIPEFAPFQYIDRHFRPVPVDRRKIKWLWRGQRGFRFRKNIPGWDSGAVAGLKGTS